MQLENPSYDPNLYQTFVPQDAVQQYVNSYGGPYPPDNAADGGHIVASGPENTAPSAPGFVQSGFPVGSGFPAGPSFSTATGFPVGFPNVQFGSTGYPNPGGFSIQSGYEGFLVPAIHHPPTPPYGVFMDILRAIIPYPRNIISLIMRSGSYLLGTVGVVLFGGAVTTAVCTLTPLCTISFAALPLLGLRDTPIAKTINETLSKEITSDRVKRAAEFVWTALRKYQQLQVGSTKEIPVVKTGSSSET